MKKIPPEPPFVKGGSPHLKILSVAKLHRHEKKSRNFFLSEICVRRFSPLLRGAQERFSRGVFFSILSIISLCFLPSCTSIPPPPTPSSPSAFSNSQDKNAWLSSLQTWQAQGSFGARKEHDAWTGTFEWNQLSKQDYRIHFYGPFGVGNTYLSGNGHHVVWQDNDEKTIASTPDELVFEKTGFVFPVSYLYYWILGRPAPGVVSQEKWDAQGHLMSFYQAGWRVTYLSYLPLANGELPSMIKLRYEDVQLKLVIRQWKIGSL